MRLSFKAAFFSVFYMTQEQMQVPSAISTENLKGGHQTSVLLLNHYLMGKEESR